jgi:hypothetical protein
MYDPEVDLLPLLSTFAERSPEYGKGKKHLRAT